MTGLADGVALFSSCADDFYDVTEWDAGQPAAPGMTNAPIRFVSEPERSAGLRDSVAAVEMSLLDLGSAWLRRLAGMTDGVGHCKPARIRREVPLEGS